MVCTWDKKYLSCEYKLVYLYCNGEIQPFSQILVFIILNPLREMRKREF